MWDCLFRFIKFIIRVFIRLFQNLAWFRVTDFDFFFLQVVVILFRRFLTCFLNRFLLNLLDWRCAKWTLRLLVSWLTLLRVRASKLLVLIDFFNHRWLRLVLIKVTDRRLAEFFWSSKVLSPLLIFGRIFWGSRHRLTLHFVDSWYSEWTDACFFDF